MGLETEGFHGLYGGIKNADDALLYEESIHRLQPDEMGERSGGRHSP
jgi:hypothetical protein